ncbi:MAG: carbonic anhydrase [Gammaproteobacteria bacterium]|nr:carbonic anhydrase [Gammaproteobacteria bacterium]
MTVGIEALKRLKEGNKRFVSGDIQHKTLDEMAKIKMSGEQSPFAIILGCSDARVPAEMIFDQGIGDLFVIRVAGNIIAPSLVGSIEYAVKQFGTGLVVVLGHSQCGAVTACVEDILDKNPEAKNQSPNLYSIVERIRPAVHTLAETPLKDDKEALVQHAVRANVRASVANLRYSSVILEKFISHGELQVVGAEFDLQTGEIDFFEGVSEMLDEV